MPILLSGSWLAFLIRIKAHEEDRRATKFTLRRSRAQGWIMEGRRLATTVEQLRMTAVHNLEL